MEMLTIDNVKYYACTDIAKKIKLKNGMEVVNKYSEYSIKKYGKWWIKVEGVNVVFDDFTSFVSFAWDGGVENHADTMDDGNGGVFVVAILGLRH